MTESTQRLWDITLKRVRRAWPLGARTALKDRVKEDLPPADQERLRQQIDACLEGRGGEVSARARAAELGEIYLVLNPHGRQRFLEILATEYDLDAAAVESAIAAWRDVSEPAARHAAALTLRDTLTPPRVRLLSQFNTLEEGVKFLVDLRAELMPLARGNPPLKALDADVQRLLGYWFAVGFLDLRRITWESPAALLEKLTEYEAVHEIQGWEDLKNRLGEDRRCYAYFHPRMPDEPLIFVEIALVNGIADNVQALLDESAPILDPERTDTAIFYSISNCQAGLAGVSFGNFLIKRVVSDLAASLPNLRNFCTLSPIPGLCAWLNECLDDESSGIDDKDRATLIAAAGRETLSDAVSQLLGEISTDDANETQKTLRRVLMHQAARYLTEAKRGQRARDRVAHFHLSNGAMVEQLNWAADLSPKGLQQSAGIMVNYLYKLSDIEKNHEAYTGQGQVTASSGVKRLAKS